MMQKHSLNLRQKNMRNARVCADYARFQRARTDLRGRTRLEIDSYNSDPGLVPPNRRSIDRLAALSVDPDYFLKALEEQDRFDD
jgi:hypothetical protein